MCINFIKWNPDLVIILKKIERSLQSVLKKEYIFK